MSMFYMAQRYDKKGISEFFDNFVHDIIYYAALHNLGYI